MLFNFKLNFAISAHLYWIVFDYWIRHKFALKYTQKWCNSFVNSHRKVLPAHFFGSHLKLTHVVHQAWLSDEGYYKIITNSLHVPLAMCRGIQCSAGRCWRALVCHTQYFQTLSLRPTAPMTGQHGRVHPLTGRIWLHNHNNTHTPIVTQTSTVYTSWTSHITNLTISKMESKVCFFIYNYI